MAVEIKKAIDACLVINKAKDSIPTLESRIKECAERKAVEENKLKAIFEETRGVTKKLHLGLKEKTQELVPLRQECTVFQIFLDTAQMEVNLLKDVVTLVLEQLKPAGGEPHSLDGMQGTKRTELLECKCKLESALSKTCVERAEGELGELGRSETTSAKRSAELMTQVEVARLLMQSFTGHSLITLAVEIKKAEDAHSAIDEAKKSFVRTKKTKGSWQEEWEVSFNTLLARMMMRMRRILRLKLMLFSSIMSMSNHNNNYSSKPSERRAYSGSRESKGNFTNSFNLINSTNVFIFGVDHQGRVNV